MLNMTDFDNRFKTNEDCLAYLYKTRWPDGYKCPRCNYSDAWEVRPYKYKCRNCGYQSTVTAGTFFHGSHLSMLQWFTAIYYISVHRDAANAVELKQLLNIGSNRTAQMVIKKLKPMCYCSDSEKLAWRTNKLDGTVEIEEKAIRFRNKRVSVIIATETHKNKCGRIRIVPAQYKDYLVDTLVAESATIRASKRYCALSHGELIASDFEKWCADKEKYKLKDLMIAYCKKINRYKVPVSFDDILRNLLLSNNIMDKDKNTKKQGAD